jgi:ATP-grasp domain
MTSEGFVAIVDPYESGSMLAPEFGRRGFGCVMVRSTPEIPEEYCAGFRAEDFAEIVGFDGDAGKTLEVLKRRRVGQVLAGSEWGVNLADRLSEALGVPSNGTRLTRARRDKFLMGEAVRAAGLRAVEQVCAGDVGELVEWSRRRGGRPVVVKPPQSMSAEGVRLCRDESELREAFAALKGRRNKLGLVNERVLAQEYLEGAEYVVDTVSYEGRHRLAGVWRYGRGARGPSRFGTFKTKELLPREGATQERLFAYAARVLDALGVRYGAGHCELMWAGGEPVLVEVGARTHGGVKAHALSRAATGTSQIDLTVECYASPEAFLRGPREPRGIEKRAAMILLTPGREGRLKGLRHTREIESLPSFYELHLDARPGGRVRRVAGLVLLVHEDAEAVERDLRRVMSLEEAGLYEFEDEDDGPHEFES